MSMRIFLALFAAAAMLAAIPDRTTAEAGCACPVQDSVWQVLPDSATAPPEFLFEPYVEVRKLLLCDHGVFFFFNSSYRGRDRPTVLAYPLPTQEQIARYFSGDGQVPSPQAIAEETVAATVRYAAFRNGIQRAVGFNRKSGRVIPFDRVHRPRPRLRFGAPLTVEYRHHTISWQGLIDVYYQY